MLRQSILIVFALFALQVNASPDAEKNPLSDFISLEIEHLELELELFGNTSNDDIASVASIKVFEVEEESTIHYDTQKYLPENFNNKEGMPELDLNSIELFELEEEEQFNFNVNDYLPVGFNPNKGMTTKTISGICLF